MKTPFILDFIRKSTTFSILIAVLFPALSCSASAVNFGIKDAFEGNFLIGAAVERRHIDGSSPQTSELLKRHFNALVAENAMKMAHLQPSEGLFDFADADLIAAFAKENGMKLIGHTLLWHESIPGWMALGSDGNPVGAEVLKWRIRRHIHAVVGRYRGIVKGWDVVNEAILENGAYRKSLFYEVLGEEYISFAFRCVREADPDAELYYNDYGMTGSDKRAAVIGMIEKLRAEGIKIDAVGMQMHIGMQRPSLEDIGESIEAYALCGCNVMVTELDMSVLPAAWGLSEKDFAAPDFQQKYNPYAEALPEGVSSDWNRRMLEILKLLERHSSAVTRVSFWGVSDGDSWLNNFPVKGRTDYPLPFDRNLHPKPFIREILKSSGR